MTHSIRKLCRNFGAGLGLAIASLIAFAPTAQAAPAEISANVNVRSGPGTSYRVIDTLVRGTRVDVGSCRHSFCEVRSRHTNGWVSSNYLTRTGSNSNSNSGQPSINFGFSVGPDGPSFNFGTGNQPPPIVTPPRPEPVVREACFYDRSNYRGRSFCLDRGQSVRLDNWADRISSIENRARLRIEICTDRRGRDCRILRSSAPNLGDFDDSILTIRVR